MHPFGTTSDSEPDDPKDRSLSDIPEAVACLRRNTPLRDLVFYSSRHYAGYFGRGWRECHGPEDTG